MQAKRLLSRSRFAALLAVSATTPGLAGGSCVQFWSGLCPSPADCECTTGHACVSSNATADGQPTQPTPTGGCAGSCRRVIRGKCPGGSGCLWDAGPCGGPIPPSPPHPAPPPPSSSAPMGPDVSHYQGPVDWSRVKAAGAGFGIAKATEGTGYLDDQFASNWRGSKAAGISVRGAYHFGHPSVDSTAQAQHFVRAVGPVGRGEFLVLDIEDATAELVAAGNWSARTQADVAAWCVAFATEVMKLANIRQNKMWIYTGAYFWRDDAGGSAALAGHPLWVAAYTASPPEVAGWPAGWSMWQYSDKGTWPGVNGDGCDSSRFKGTQAELEALVG